MHIGIFECRELLISIFENCDPNGVRIVYYVGRTHNCHNIIGDHSLLTQTNAIDRLRVLYLLASYYDSLPDDQKQLLRNPRQCK